MNAYNQDKKMRAELSKDSKPAVDHKPVWDVHPHLKCPLLGMCLNLEEHKRILKKTGHSVKRLDAYELHRSIKSYLDGENRVSMKVDRYLSHKFRADLAELGNLCEDDFMATWRDRLMSGKIEEIFFVACVRDDLSEESLSEIYGEVHMAGHANSAESMRMRRYAELQKAANHKTAKLLNQEKQQTRSLREEVRLLKTYMDEKHLKSKQLQSAGIPDSTHHSIKCDDEKNRTLQKQLGKIEKEKRDLTIQLQMIEREKRRLQIELFDLQSTNQRMAEDVKALTVQIGSLFDCSGHVDNPCQKFQLCAKRILIVGGMSKMKHLYRDLIKASGGEFEYHDGYMKAGKKKLEAQVSRCDLVLCPVNCNSHGACNSVKTFCKKFNKPFKMLPGASLSTISSALIESSSQEISTC